MTKRKPRSVRHVSRNMIDEIKDEIDRLQEINSPTQRHDAALDLIEYIQLHHMDPS